ncbi:UNVERIFIED_CONTAM: hypothetical protein GTU68_003788 [Idotea baltica]|nr:hypothetical protein [Idotea baltica]
MHVIDRARESDASSIVVATDDERIASVCTDAGAEVEMTDIAHVSGTDRIAEVATRRGWADDCVIVGLQGDEPATPASMLNQLAGNLSTFNDANMASFCIPVSSVDEYRNSHRVKVVRDHRNMALYFSRASIPARRDDTTSSDFPESFIHVGLYAYRCHFLKQFSTMAPAYIEEQEQLEQLRVLYNGGRIHVDEVREAAAGVDHTDDVPVIEALLKQHFQS